MCSIKSFTPRAASLLIILTLTFGAVGQFHVTAQDGKIIADSGFRPNVAGFGFQNYGNEINPQNLTSAELRRVYGDAVCAKPANSDGSCELTPPAQQEIDRVNAIMNGGHCEGMAVLSWLLYAQKETPADFGGDKTVGLAFDGNAKLQREIAYWWALQTTPAVRKSRVATLQQAKSPTPNGLTDLLVDAINNKTEAYTIAIFQREYKNGHAITPYAVVDKGSDIYWIMVYDNNFPNEERHIEIDRKANTWKYYASINPSVPNSLYEGGADSFTFLLVPLSARFQQNACPFCAGGSSRTNGLASAATQYNTIYMTSADKDNQADLLITDDQGHKLGYQNGKFYHEIPNADYQPIVSADLWEDEQEPTYYVPTGISFTITIDGSSLKKEQVSSVVMIGPGYDIGVDDIKLSPGEKDTLTLSPDGRKLTYTPSSSEAPDIVVGLEHTGADYSFLINGFDLDVGGAVNVDLDYDKGQLSVSTTGSKNPAVYGLEVNRIDATTDQSFFHDGVELEPGATALIDFGKWDGKGDLTIEIDTGSDGKIDQTLTEPNQPK